LLPCSGQRPAWTQHTKGFDSGKAVKFDVCGRHVAFGLHHAGLLRCFCYVVRAWLPVYVILKSIQDGSLGRQQNKRVYMPVNSKLLPDFMLHYPNLHSLLRGSSGKALLVLVSFLSALLNINSISVPPCKHMGYAPISRGATAIQTQKPRRKHATLKIMFG
jgi:hypothetical protein